MQLRQYYLGCLAHASYMVADETTGTAAVIDPQRDIDQYVADAAANGWKIEHVFLTHFHADFLAGHIELREKTGAKIYLGAKAKAEYHFTPLREGEEVVLGEVRFRILETPGHTPEGISLLLFDTSKSATEPQAVFTGDTLFIGDVGRPDLLASIGVTADELAEMLYDSLTNKLMKLPDATLVYPAHGAGSMCGKQLSSQRVSTIGEQKQFNYALQPMTKEAFIKLVEVDQPEAPGYFIYDAIRNKQERPALEESLRQALTPLPVDEVLRLANQGAQVVDVRETAEFAGAHLVGSINIGLQGKYATWAGTLLDREKPIVVVAEPGTEEEAMMRLGRIGFDNAAGYLKDGLAALNDRPELIRSTARVTAAALAEQLGQPEAPTVLDVRAPNEWQQEHIQGSVNIPLPHLVDQLDQLSPENNLVVHCRSGYRSSIAASLLEKHGFARVTDLVGGIEAWKASQLAVAATTSSAG